VSNNDTSSIDNTKKLSEELVDPDKVKITPEGVAYTVKNSFWEVLIEFLGQMFMTW